MMKEIKATILNKTKEGVVIGIPPSTEVDFKTSKVFKYGQTVWVAYDFTTMRIVSVSATQSVETPSHNNVPTPTFPGCSIEETHPIVEEEEYIEVEDIEEGFYGSD